MNLLRRVKAPDMTRCATHKLPWNPIPFAKPPHPPGTAIVSSKGEKNFFALIGEGSSFYPSWLLSIHWNSYKPKLSLLVVPDHSDRSVGCDGRSFP